mmetsp:Transcript_38126/g.89864  ORF Transcript_38126/g.89864 Transcript_38126/m.89864 type:complete len:721 (+) Transcript_38126:162-2324(+)
MPPKKADEPPPPPPKQLKIFIHEMDGYLGKVLGEQAKKNVAEGEEPIICGSLSDPKNKPSWADEVVKRDDLLGLKKALLTSDVIIYDVSSAPKDATSALKVLLKYDYEDETEKVMIGVSSLLSWAGNSSALVDPSDEAAVAAAAAEQPAPLTSAQAAERRPHPNYKAQVTVENLIINKGNVKKDKLKTYVVWSGVLYGCGEGVLHSLFKCSWLGTHKALPVLGTGANKIPMIHVADLAGMALALAKERPSEFNTVLAVDRGETTLKEVATAISKALQGGEVKECSEEEYLAFTTAQAEPHEHSILLQLNLQMSFVRGEALGYGEESDKWIAGSGLVENIDRVVTEYRDWRSLQPMRVLFHGPPASYWYPTEGGRVDLARDFAEEYDVTYLDLKAVIEEYRAKPPFSEGGTDLGAKLEEVLAEDAEAEVPEELLVQVVQHKLQTPPCRNQGFVLAAFPKTRELAEALFNVDKVPAEGETPEEEAPAEVGEGEEPPPPLAPLPQTVFSLVAPQELLLARLAALPQEEAEANGETEEAFQAEWAAWEEANPLSEDGTPSTEAGLLALYLTNKPNPEGGRPFGCEQVVDIVSDNPLSFIQDKIRLSVGAPRNYDPEGPRRAREAQQKAEEEAKEAKVKAAREAEEAGLWEAREAKAKADAEKLARLQEEEREALLLRSQPMRKYLMENVLPSLTKGLQEVAKLRPDDPIDALADYLFKVDPQLN